MLGMTIFFFFVELIVGQITHSIALTTDSFHMLFDSLSHVIAIVSFLVT
jgi:zinc transporter 1